jgi:hypothetical protein
MRALAGFEALAKLGQEDVQRLKRRTTALRHVVVGFLEQGVDLVAILGEQTVHLLVGDGVVERLLGDPLACLWARGSHNGSIPHPLPKRASRRKFRRGGLCN